MIGKVQVPLFKVYGDFLKASILDLRPGSLTGPGIQCTPASLVDQYRLHFNYIMMFIYLYTCVFVLLIRVDTSVVYSGCI